MKKILSLLFALCAISFTANALTLTGPTNGTIGIEIKKMVGKGIKTRSMTIMPDVRYSPNQGSIEVRTPVAVEMLQVTVYDATGVVDFDMAQNSDYVSVNFSTLNPGLYEVIINVGSDAYSGLFEVE